MLSVFFEIKNSDKVIGLKQVSRAIRDKFAAKVFVAYDADEKLTLPVIDLCEKNGLSVVTGFTMEQLGQACEIDVGASVVAIVNGEPKKNKRN